jgi:hypothetical protein
MKQVRITFRAEIYVEGETVAECKEKFESMNIFAPESKSRFIETVSIEDADTFKNIEEEWDMCDEDDGLDYSPTMRKAVAYAMEQMEPEDIAIIGAKVGLNFKQDMNPAYGIDEGKISDLLEEYGQDNDLPEGWWMEECDMDDIVLLIAHES